MNIDLTGRVALVTAASRGLGFACANALAQAGAKVAICSRSMDNVTAAAQEISAHAKEQVLPVVADLACATDIDNMHEKVIRELGEVDILVVSTAHPPTMPFSRATDEDWELGHKLLVEAPRRLARHVVNGMAEREYGRILFIGSIFGREAEASSVIQSTYRAGLNGLTKCISTEYASRGVTTNVLCPGYFTTPLVQNLAQQYADEQGVPLERVLDDWRSASPANQFGKPEDLGAFVAFLCSQHGNFFQGTALTIDGGAVRRT